MTENHYFEQCIKVESSLHDGVSGFAKNLEHEETREIMEYIQAVHTQLPVIALGLPHTLKSSVYCVLFEYLSL